MPKSQIIKDVVEDIVPIETSLNRILVLAKDISNKELESWAENELGGYSDTDIPDYRIHSCGNIRYSGINGNCQVNHIPLNFTFIGSEYYEKSSAVIIGDGIRTVCEFAESDKPISRDLSFLANEVYKRSKGVVTCTSIEQVVPQAIFQRIVAEVKKRMINILYELEKEYGILDDLGIDVSSVNKEKMQSSNEEISNMINSDIQRKKKVFIVHGHDDELKQTVARVIEHAGLEAVILHEQADEGKTIIEKLEHHSKDVAYAVVLYTGCDTGRSKNESNESLRPRARQNVVFEHGLFIGKLGRSRVSALVKEDVEKPGDIDGVVYIPVDEGGGWKTTLAKNMKSAGIEFDFEKMVS